MFEVFGLTGDSMINKKGQLKENTLEALVAAIAIVIIVAGAGYFVYKYFQISAQQNEDSAKGLLNVLDAKIKATKDNQLGNFLLKGPCESNELGGNCNWFLTGWGKNDDNRPQRCFFKSCVCVCNAAKSATTMSDKDTNLRDSCQSGQTGYCTSVDAKEVKVFSVQKQKQDIPTFIEGVANDPGEHKPDIRKSFIPFKSNLIELNLKRTGETLEISLV